jgi:acyl-coenzyme A thioesterase PaaI-like protein
LGTDAKKTTEDVAAFLRAISEDAEVPDKYRIQAAGLSGVIESNPFTSPIRFFVENGRARGHGSFDSTFEGSPGIVHGGFVAAAFDQLLFTAASLTGKAAATATLTIRYLSPTPLRSRLEFEAEVETVEGRKIFTRGRVSAEGITTAEAEGLFIATDR